MRAVRSGFLVGIAVSALIAASPASAQADKPLDFDVPAQSLTEALRQVAREGGLEFSAPADPLRDKKSVRLKGTYTIEDAARRLLAGTPLTADVTEGALIVRDKANSASHDRLGNENDIVVTGSRIDSAETASPTIRLTVDTIRLAGQTNLGEAMRTLPQNFSGGQNPGVASGVIGITNQNLNSGSSPNLRGLGADATLTLLNGHRLSYGSFVQAVDISAIPLAAVDRIEVVPDGASAIYGSDAVGGVVNVILKSNYDGLSMLASVGGASEGGYFKQQYSAVAGQTWSTGNFMVAYSHDRNSAIFSHDRDFTSYMPTANTLYPQIVQNSILISGRQSFGDIADFFLDATYNSRTSISSQDTTYGDIYINTPRTEDLSFSPTLRFNLIGDWAFQVSGTYGRSRTKFEETTIFEGSILDRASGCYCNELASADAYASGSLISINGNRLKMVLGGGYRHNHYETARYNSGRTDTDGSIESFYAFSEISIPFFEPGQGNALLHSLSLDAALRYERYPGIASVAVPKIGVIYGLSPSIDIKATWGKSFKAPMLSNQFADRIAYLYPASSFGGQRFPAGSTLLVDYGGNTDLKPERATSWSTTLAVHPTSVPSLNFQASYFHVSYKDRVVQPAPGAASSRVLSDPTYASFVTFDPSQGTIDGILASADRVLNYAGANSASRVVAILNNQYINASRQQIHGIDASFDYKIAIGEGAALLFNAGGSWLWSRQQISADIPTTRLAGTIFNPPRFKGRASAGWINDQFSITGYINHVSSLTDNRSTPSVNISSQTTIDTSVRHKFSSRQGLFSGVTLLLNLQNVFDQRPPYAAPTSGLAYYVNYDSTNFSPIGRFIGLAVAKDW